MYSSYYIKYIILDLPLDSEKPLFMCLSLKLFYTPFVLCGGNTGTLLTRLAASSWEGC